MGKKEPNKSELILYQTEDGQTKLQVKIEDETVWLTQDQMAELFEKGRTTITEHIQNAFKEGELDEKAVCREFRRTGADGKEYLVKYYNLDVIISVGYRVRSLRGAQFRIWATQRLKEYIIKGFTLDANDLRQAVARRGILKNYCSAYGISAVASVIFIRRLPIFTSPALITGPMTS